MGVGFQIQIEIFSGIVPRAKTPCIRGFSKGFEGKEFQGILGQ